MKRLLALLALLIVPAAAPAQLAKDLAFDQWTGTGWAEVRVTPGAGHLMALDANRVPITLGLGTGFSVVSGSLVFNGAALPDQTGNAGKYLTTNGTAASWATISGGAWGAITGTLSNQTDLQAALDLKADTTALAAYLTTASAASTYQPLDTDLTAIAALTTTTHGRALLTDADAAASRTRLGLGTLATQSATITDYLTTATAATTYQPLDAQLTDLAGLSYAGNALKVVRVNAGATGWELATVSAGSGDMVLADAQTVTGTKTFLSSALAMRESGGGSDVITFAAPAVSGARTLTLPISTGTLALTSDIPTNHMTKPAYDPQDTGYTLSGITGQTNGSGTGGTGGTGPALFGGAGADSGSAFAAGGNGGSLNHYGGAAAAAATAAARGGHAGGLNLAGGRAEAVTDGAGSDYAGRGGDAGTINVGGGEGHAFGLVGRAGGDGGSLLMYGGDGDSDLGAPGGSILTFAGGGSINTRGTGSIEFGADGTRTTVTGTASANRAIAWPDASGTVALTADLASYLTTATAATTYQPLDAQLTDLAGLSYAGNAGKFVRVNAGATGWELASASGSGTVTQVSVVSANGISGSVANDTTTPAITLSLGAITPTTVNGLTLTTTTGTLTVASGKTLTASNTLTFAGTDGSTLDIGAGGTLGTAAFTASSAYQAADAQLTDLAGLAPTKGRLIVGDGTNWVDLGVGTDTHVLTADSAQAKGVKWAAAAGGGGGKVVAIKTATSNARQSSSSTTWTDITSLSITHTPASASNKVLLIASINGASGGTSANLGIQFVRASTAVGVGDNEASNRTAVGQAIMSPGTDSAGSLTHVYSDSPATTSSTTWKVQFAALQTSGAVYINRTANDSNNVFSPRGLSTLTLIEYEP